MTKFPVAVSRAENWSSAAKELETALVGYHTDGDEVQLGWLYVTDVYAADLSSMHTYLRQKTGIDHWVGSVGMGICWHDGVGDVGEAFDRPVQAVVTEYLAAPESVPSALCTSMQCALEYALAMLT